MELTQFFLAFFTLLPLANAWNLHLYSRKNYKGLISHESNAWIQSCKTLARPVRSLKWDGEAPNPHLCMVLLYDNPDCSGNNPVYNSGLYDKNDPSIPGSSQAYMVDCVIWDRKE